MSSQSSGTTHYASALILALVLLVPSLGIELLDTLYTGRFSFSFDRQLISEGQWWRLLLGHFDHLSWSHLFVNAVFLSLLLIAFSCLTPFRTVIPVVLLCSLGISFLIWFLSTELAVYVGLSGCLYSLLVFGLLRSMEYPLWLRFLVFLGLVIKVVYEYCAGTGQQMSGFIGGAVATDVHLYGVVMGVLCVLFLKLFRL